MIKFISPLIRQQGIANTNSPKLEDVFIFKGEKLGLQLELELKEKIWVNLNKNISIPWSGLTKAYRIEIEEDKLLANIQFEENVQDDDGIVKKDRIVKDKAKFLGVGSHVLWVDIEIKEAGVYHPRVKVYEREGYSEESLIYEESIEIEVADHNLEIDDGFYLDLWQHPTSVANYYKTEIFSDEHLKLMDSFLEPLGEAGQKVCSLIVSDYPWSGQSCHIVKENSTSLYEYNILKVAKVSGQLKIDFSSMDKYIELCVKHGISEEINLFGLVDNWDRHEFSHPLEDYGDAIRVRYYDTDRGVYDFLRKKEEIREYIQKIFDHLKEKGHWEKVKVMGDMPEDTSKSTEFQVFLRSIDPNVSIKYALHIAEFLNHFDGEVDSFSMALPTLLEEYKDKKSEMVRNMDKLTWYVCRYPKNFNQFIKSPLVESRLIGYYTYAFGMKGFLRWNYCLWPGDIDEDTRYRPDMWPAGDMFFVYPNRMGKPDFSLRFKHMVYGINEYNVLKAFEKKLGRDKIAAILKTIIGDINKMSYDEETDLIYHDYIDDFKLINEIKKELKKAVS